MTDVKIIFDAVAEFAIAGGGVWVLYQTGNVLGAIASKVGR